MRKNRSYIICIMIVTVLIMCMTGCGAESTDKQGNSGKSGGKAKAVKVGENEPVKFADPIFENYLRSAMGRLSGDITGGDLAEIRQIGIDITTPYMGDPDKAMGIVREPYDEDISLYNLVDYAALAEYDYQNEDNEKSMIHVKSLEDLKYFPNLELVVVNYTFSNADQGFRVKNLDFLSYLPNLKAFYAHNSAANDLSAFAQCKNLEVLCMMNEDLPVEGLEALSACENLKRVELNQVKDWSGLLAIPNLESVVARGQIDEETEQALIAKGVEIK